MKKILLLYSLFILMAYSASAASSEEIQSIQMPSESELTKLLIQADLIHIENKVHMLRDLADQKLSPEFIASTLQSYKELYIEEFVYPRELHFLAHYSIHNSICNFLNILLKEHQNFLKIVVAQLQKKCAKKMDAMNKNVKHIEYFSEDDWLNIIQSQ